MDLLKKKEFYLNTAVLFFCMMPFVEIYRSFFRNSVQIFGVCAEEIVIFAVGAAVIAGALYFLISEKQKKKLIFFFAVAGVAAVYLVLHCVNTSRFDLAAFSSDTTSPSFFVEAYYLVRMYIFPAFVAVSAFFLGFTEKKFYFTVRFVVIVVSSVIILTDIFGISFIAYSDGNVRVEGGLFSWYSLSDDADFAAYTAKGLFSPANAVGILLFSAVPVLCADAASNGKKYYLVLAADMISTVMVGTKAATYGAAVGVFTMAAVMVLSVVFRSEEKKKLIDAGIMALIVILWIPFLVTSPGYKMQKKVLELSKTDVRDTPNIEEVSDIISEDPEEIKLGSSEISELSEYIHENIWNHCINPWFVEMYPVEKDPSFWAMVVARDARLNSSNRSFKTEMLKRVVERNNNPLDAVLGIGETTGVLYTERDYVFQYYVYGAAGVFIFILSLIAVAVFSCVRAAKRLFTGKKAMLCAASAVSIAAFLGVAYLSGHVFDTVPNVYFVYFYAAAAFLLPEGETK